MRKSVRARWKCGGIVLPLVIGLTGCGTSPSTSLTTWRVKLGLTGNIWL